MKDIRKRFAESPPAAARPLPFRNAYEAHPFGIAAIPIGLGLATWYAGTAIPFPLLTIVGAGIAAFGVFIEMLNLVDLVWRWRRKRK